MKTSPVLQTKCVAITLR